MRAFTLFRIAAKNGIEFQAKGTPGLLLLVDAGPPNPIESFISTSLGVWRQFDGAQFFPPSVAFLFLSFRSSVCSLDCALKHVQGPLTFHDRRM
jgi:hypothetical protein